MTALADRDRDLILRALAVASLEWELLAKATNRIDVAGRYRDSVIDAKSLFDRLVKEPVS